VREELERSNTPKSNIFSREQDLGHHNRFLSKKKITSTLQPIGLFPQPQDEKDGYRADENDELLTGYV